MKYLADTTLPTDINTALDASGSISSTQITFPVSSDPFASNGLPTDINNALSASPVDIASQVPLIPTPTLGPSAAPQITNTVNPVISSGATSWLLPVLAGIAVLMLLGNNDRSPRRFLTRNLP